MDTKREVISKTKVICEVPPDREELSKMDYKILFAHSKELGISMEYVKNIGDKDEGKAKLFMVNECLRIKPPYPQSQNPVIIDVKLDISKMKKTNTVKSVNHIIKDNKYSHSEIVVESYSEPLSNSEIDRKNKDDKLHSIKSEVRKLKLEDYLTKESVLDFACNNGKSSGDKRLRATEILKAIQPHLKEKLQSELQEYEKDKYIKDDKGTKVKKIKPKYNHIRITNYDISVY